MPSPSKTARIPLDIDKKANVIVLRVLLKGTQGARIIKMALDTGASLSTIPSEAALAIGCDPAKTKKRIEMITASGTESVPVIVIPKMRFLGFELRNLEAACMNLPPQSLLSGLLGLNALKNFDLLLAFLGKTLELKR
jgi:clan AA aspartic protease (TIGR02281 family)